MLSKYFFSKRNESGKGTEIEYKLFTVSDRIENSADALIFAAVYSSKHKLFNLPYVILITFFKSG